MEICFNYVPTITKHIPQCKKTKQKKHIILCNIDNGTQEIQVPSALDWHLYISNYLLSWTLGNTETELCKQSSGWCTNIITYEIPSNL